jgi:hypothetical protein
MAQGGLLRELRLERFTPLAEPHQALSEMRGRPGQMGGVAMKLDDAHMAEAKRWAAKLVKAPQRPLKGRAAKELKADGIHERLQREFGLRTLGEARDMVGKELRIRARETIG